MRSAVAACRPRWPTRMLAALREILRGACGADAYARYLEHQATHHPDQPTLTRAAFFRRHTEERWSGISRCC